MAPSKGAQESESESESGPTRVMLDLETLGLEPGVAIVSLGAVAFDTTGLGPTFYRSIDLESCVAAGLDIDAETLMWWLDEEKADRIRVELTGGDPLADVLTSFGMFYESVGAEEVWANSPAFDCKILEHAYKAFSFTIPWEFYEMRDFRTLKHLVDVDVEREGEEHHALDDSRYQARYAVAALSALQE